MCDKTFPLSFVIMIYTLIVAKCPRMAGTPSWLTILMFWTIFTNLDSRFELGVAMKVSVVPRKTYTHTHIEHFRHSS